MTPARKPNVLIPLIKAKLEAGVSAYRDAGKLLLEAKAGLEHGEFQPWIKRHFKLSYSTAATYMRAAAKSGACATFRQIKEDPFTRRNQPRQDPPTTERRPDLDTDDPPEEVKLNKSLALELVTIGFRELSKIHHPDKGGSTAAMQTLNAVRKSLTSYIEREM